MPDTLRPPDKAASARGPAGDRGAATPAASRLVGREPELLVLDRMLADLGRGQTLGVELAGDPGIGKTRLLDELCRRGSAREMLVLGGQATEFEREVPFGIFVDALDDHLALMDPEALAPLGDTHRTLLAAVLPALAKPVAGPPLDLVEVERHRLHRAFRALLAFLARAAGTGPGKGSQKESQEESQGDGQGLLLVLDDLHWADTGSLELLDHLLRHPPDAPLLLALAHRPRQAPPRLARTLDRAHQAQRVRRVEVRPLAAGALDLLIGPGTGPARRAELRQASGGNPFYLEALARSPVELHTVTGRESGAEDSEADIPPAVRSALVAEVEAASPAAIVVALGAAVAGESAEPNVVAEIAEMDEATTLSALDELARRDVLRPAESPGRFRFRHPIVRRVVYATAETGWRLAAHTRAAAALERQGAPVTLRAHHVERSARPGDRDAADLLVAAARESYHQSPETAAHWFHAALRLLPHGSESADLRSELQAMLAMALATVGRVREGRDILHEMLHRLPPGPGGWRTRAVVGCATMERLLGRHDEARALLLLELARLPGDDVPDAVDLMLELGWSCYRRADFHGVRDWVRQSLPGIERLGRPDRRACALGLLALSETLLGEIPAARERAAEAARLIDGLVDAELIGNLEALDALGWAEVSLGQFREALRHFGRGLALARRSGNCPYVLDLLLGQCMAHAWLGELGPATAAVEDALEVAQLPGSDEILLSTLICACQVRLWRGDVRAARGDADRIEALRGPVGAWFSGIAGGILAQAYQMTGEAERSIAVLLDAGGGPDLPRLTAPLRPSFYSLLTRAELMCGQVGRAERWTDRARRLADRLSLASTTGFAFLAEADLALARGEAATAVARAEEALRYFARIGMRLYEGRAHALAGAALAAMGDTNRGFEEFGRAKTIFRACGAAALEGELVQAQRRLGSTRSRARHAPDAGPLVSLTAREREIATMVAEGRTNRDIATRLFVSEKTVEAHLTRVFSKIGVRSRTGLVALLARADDQPGG